MQAAFHQAFRAELYRCLDGLPVDPDSRLLDAPCGDGFYAARLGRRLGPGGSLTLADASDACLDFARQKVETLRRHTAVRLERADVYSLPFDDGSFDLAWCAQSLISLDDPAAALRELARVARPGGTVAVLENDEFHHLLLPWPIDLELAVFRAMQQASRQKYGDGGRLAWARRVRRHLLEAGLRPTRQISLPADRHAPFDPATAAFLRLHLHSLAQMVRPHLRDAARQAFDAFIDPDGPRGIHRRADGELTCLNVVHLALEPAHRRGRRRDDRQKAAG
jgi:ubiquinone/menaquinone biosynthesis C-methylase UbiE